MLQAGPLTVGYENGFLRRITYDGTEVLRMIYFALRDHNWVTIRSEIENEDLRSSDSAFDITYDCVQLHGGTIVMEWKGRIAGKPDGTIVFEIQGIAKENFKKNRAGFCVLHPLNTAGVECTVIHPDQSRTTRPFPVEVAAENPFKNIQAMLWKSNGVPFEMSFEGDVFETEDQRNWGDASYKTFCTPLDRPFPVELNRGQKVFQRVTFRPAQALTAGRSSSGYVSLLEPPTRSVLPFLGVCASTETSEISREATRLIGALNLKHYRIDVHPSRENWVSDFSHAYEIAFALRLPLEAALHLTERFSEEMESFSMVCRQNRVNLRKVLLLSARALVTSSGVIDKVSILKDTLPNVLVGAGSDYNFNEINKNHFTPGNIDFVSFSVDPQEHAFDDLTILENIEAHEHLVRSAKSIYGETMPVHISPLTLRKRSNPYATDPADLFIPEEAKADPRQKEAFAAVWTFGSLCNLSRGKAAAVTLFQTTGNQGILSNQGEPYPVYDVIKNFALHQGRPVSILESSDSLSVQGIVFDGRILALANLTKKEKSVRFGKHEILLGPLEMKFEPLHRA